MAFLELRRVSFTYPKGNKPALRQIDLSLERDEIIAVVGPNGSGKTTLTKLMVGILPPAEGEISLEDRPQVDYTLAEIGRRIGYVFQNPGLQLFCSTVSEEIGFGPMNLGCDPAEVAKRVDFYLDYFELTPYRNTFPLHLSQGEKQRLALAAVLAGEPGFLILDEPTIGLDPYRKKRLADCLNQIARTGRGMMLVSHDLPFVSRVAGRVISLENGRIRGDSGGHRQ